MNSSLKNITPYFRPLLGIGPLVSILFTSSIIPLSLLYINRKTPFSQKYTDFIVGSITWGATNKTIDYYALLLFFCSFIISLIVLNITFHIISYSGEKIETLRSLNTIFLISLVPVGWWLGECLIYPQLSYQYLIVGCVTIFLAALTCLFLCRYAEKIEAQELLDIFGGILIVFILVFAAGLSFTTALGRGSIALHQIMVTSGNQTGVTSVTKVMIVLSVGFLFALLGVYWASNTAEKLRDRLFHIIFWLQLPLPLLFLILLPPPWLLDNTLIQGYKTSLSLYIILCIIIFLSFGSWYRRWRSWLKTENRGAQTLGFIIVPSGIVAFILFINIPPIGLPQLAVDDYHIGEWYLPWQQLVEFGKIPFVDLNYPHGFVHLIHGFFAGFFFDGTAASFIPANTLLFACALAAMIFAIYALFGPFVAFMIAYTFPLAYMSHNHWFIISSFLLLIMNRLLKKPALWVLSWGIVSLFLIFYAMSTGTAFAIGTFPLAFWMTLRAVREQPKFLTQLIVASLSLGTILFAVTPMGKITYSLILYLKENSSVNTIANGIPWGASLGVSAFSNGVLVSGLLWEFLRVGWMFVTVIVLFVILKELTKPQDEKQNRVLLFGISILLYLLVFMVYSFGRIDSAALTRTGRASLWAVAIALPLLLLLINKKKSIPYFILFYPLIGGASSAILQKPIPEPSTIVLKSFIEIPVTAKQIEFSTHAGLPNLGRLILEQDRLNALIELQQELHKLLRQGETYLDLTNHSARYFFLGYPVPIFESASYNAPSTEMQQRILHQLKKNPSPVVLVDGDTILYDGGPASMRTNLIYRHFALTYVPIKRGRYIFLVQPERAKGLPILQQVDILPLASLTDTNWTKGISSKKERTGVLLKDKFDSHDIKVGDKIIFAHSGQRTVSLIDGEQLWFEGKPLDPEADGFPNSVLVEKTNMTQEKSKPSDITETKLVLLDKAFRAEHLQKIPVSWGRSWQSLAPLLQKVGRVDVKQLVSTHVIKKNSDGSYTPRDRDSQLVFNVADLKLKGASAAYVSFVFNCEHTDLKTEPELELYWENTADGSFNENNVIRFYAENGRVLVPLDSSPRWLLSQGITRFRIDLRDHNSCRKFTLDEIYFLKRRDTGL